jgi:hypothetical protein
MLQIILPLRFSRTVVFLPQKSFFSFASKLRADRSANAATSWLPENLLELILLFLKKD